MRLLNIMFAIKLFHLIRLISIKKLFKVSLCKLNIMLFCTSGDLILSSADDCTMRIWDATTGAEIVTVTSLPAPIFPGPGEGQQLMLHPVNPCCFSPSGDKIASGTEIGEVMLWDTSGVQVKLFFFAIDFVCGSLGGKVDYAILQYDRDDHVKLE